MYGYGGEPTAPSRFRFGLFELDLRRGELRSNGRPVRLSPQPSKLLTLLVSRPGELITRDEIRRHLWGTATHADVDASLNFCIRQIRFALRDQGDAPRYIATLPKRGYRFIAPVEVLPTNGSGSARQSIAQAGRAPNAGSDGSAETGSSDRGSHSRFEPSVLLVPLVAVVIAVSSLFVASGPRFGAVPERIRIAVLPFEDLSANSSPRALGDDVTAELVLQLSSTSAQRLAVIARTSTLAYRGSPKSVQQIARELDVSYVVEGTIRSAAPGRVHIGVTLVRAADQSVIWADEWERDRKALLSLQREVAARIKRALALH